MPNISSLPETSVVVSLHMSRYEGHKYDREASESLVASYGAERGAARVNKLIVPKTWIDPVTKAFGRVYTHHVGKTLPWMDNGQRILSSAMHGEYMREHKKLVSAAYGEVERAVNSYRTVVLDTAQRRLNGLYKVNDFPSSAKLRSLFSIELSFTEVPVNDIRCEGLSDGDLQEMNESKERAFMSAIEAANRDAFLRIYNAVARMADRLKAYDDRERVKATGAEVSREGTFRDSVVENIRELVEDLPKMNFSRDTELDAMVDTLRRNLLRTNADGLRGNASERKRAMAEANRILRNLSPRVVLDGQADESEVA